MITNLLIMQCQDNDSPSDMVSTENNHDKQLPLR